MATIIPGVSLGSGVITSSAIISDPSQVRIHFDTTGATEGDYSIVTYLVNDGAADAPLTDENDCIVENKITENNPMSKNLIAVNSASIKVVVTPKSGSTGTLTATTKEI